MSLSPQLPPALDPERARTALIDADKQIDAASRRLSLCPEREWATPIAELFDGLSASDPPELRLAFARGLRRCALAQLKAFPENIFWDLDFLAASLLEQARAAGPQGPALMNEMTGLVAALQDLFGSGSPIRFRYVHDFVYGYDWAKWVTRNPKDRSDVGPFDHRFLRYMWRRGHELLALIAHDDDKYPKLPDGMPRNPFVFSRDPANEEKLFADLAEAGALPVQSWRFDPRLDPTRPFYVLREERARALGLVA